MVRGPTAVRAAGRRHPHARSRRRSSPPTPRRSAPSRSRSRRSGSRTRATAVPAFAPPSPTLAAGAYDWVVFTSPNGVERTFDRRSPTPGPFGRRSPPSDRAPRPRSPHATVVADLVPGALRRRGSARRVPRRAPGGGRVLLARAAVARDVLPDGLRAKGWSVDVVEAYRTVPADADPGAARPGRGRRRRHVHLELDRRAVPRRSPADRVPPVVACIGPVTAETARRRGPHGRRRGRGPHHRRPRRRPRRPLLVDRRARLRLRRPRPRHRDVLVRRPSPPSSPPTARRSTGRGGSTRSSVRREHPHWSVFLDERATVPIDDLEARVKADRLAHHHALVAEEIVRPGRRRAPRRGGRRPVCRARSRRARPTTGSTATSTGSVCSTASRRSGAGDDVAPGRTKPAPDIFLAACAALGADPAGAVALEDSPNGVAGRRRGRA